MNSPRLPIGLALFVPVCVLLVFSAWMIVKVQAAPVPEPAAIKSQAQPEMMAVAPTLAAKATAKQPAVREESVSAQPESAAVDNAYAPPMTGPAPAAPSASNTGVIALLPGVVNGPSVNSASPGGSAGQIGAPSASLSAAPPGGPPAYSLNASTGTTAAPALLPEEMPENLPAGLAGFANSVVDGQTGVLRGVYIDGLLALSIQQQPPGNAAYISSDPNATTLFQTPAASGVFGLLAHNYLAGALFPNISVGQEIFLIYGDGRLGRYQVKEIANFERLQKGDLQSDFRDLETGLTQSTDAVYGRFYRGAHHLTLQTCLEKDGVLNWGVTFIIADPVQ